MTWQKPSLKRIVKHTILGSIALVLIGLALLTSTMTVRLAASLATSLVDGLQLEQVDGDLIHGVKVKNIRYQHAELTVQVSNAFVSWDPICLPHICVPVLSATSAVVELASSDAKASIAAENSTALAKDASGALVPAWLDIRLLKLSLAEFELKTADQQVRLRALQTGAHVTATTVVLSPTTVEQLQVQTTGQAKASPPLDVGATIHDIMQLWPSWTFDAPSLSITQLTLDQLELSQLHLGSQLNATALVIDKFQLGLAPYQLSFNGHLSRDEQWQGQLSVLSSGNKPPLQANLQFQGPFKATKLSGKFELAQLPVSDEVTLSSLSDVQATLNLLQPAPQIDLIWKTPALTIAHAPKIVVNNTAKSTKNSSKAQDSAANDAGFFPQAPENVQLNAAHQQGQLLDVAMHLQGSWPHLALELQGRSQWPGLPNAALQLAGTWQNNRFAVAKLNVDTLNGQLGFVGDVDAAQLQGRLQIDKLQPGLYWTDFPGEFSGATEIRLSYAKQFDVQLSKQQWQGTIRSLPLDLTGDLHLWFREHWRLATEGIALTHGKNQLRLTGSLDDAWQLSAQAEVPDVSQSLPWAEGTLNADVMIGGPYASPNLQFSLEGNELSWGDDYSLMHAQFTGLVRQFGDLSSQMALTIKGLASPSLQIRELAWQTDGTLAAHQSTLSVNSPQLKAKTEFSAGWKQGVWNGQFSLMDLDSDLGHWLLEPSMTLAIDLSEQQIKLSDSCFTENSSRVCVKSQGWLSAQQGGVRLVGDAVALQNFDWLLPGQFGLAGAASGDASVRWSKGQLQQATWQIEATQGMYRYQGYSPVELAWKRSSLVGQLDRQRLTSKLSTQFTDTQQASVALDVSEFGLKTPKLDATIQAQQVDLKFLQPLFNEYSKFAGTFNADVKLTGPATMPDARGEIRLSDLAMTGSAAPIDLKPSSLVVRLFGRQAELAADLHTAEGPLEWQGRANWLQPEAWSAQSSIRAELLKLQTSYGDLQLKPDLQFFANPQGGSISGLLVVPKGQLQFNDLPEDAVRISSDEVMVETASNELKPSWTLSSDIRLILGEQVKFAAFGLKTRLQGELRVRQANNQPTIHGQVNLKDGVFRAYGQDLQLTKGRLTFNGLPQQPLLTIEAIRNKEKTEDNVVAGIRVNGTADDPTVEVFSKPSKPQANALAYLLLGRDLGTSQGDGAMTTGLIGLGIASSGKLVGKLGEAFGVSDLALDTSGSGDNSKVTVSGYLSPKLQVKYGVGIFSQFGEFTLRYRIIKQLYLEAVRGLDSSVDLLYKVEFD